MDTIAPTLANFNARFIRQITKLFDTISADLGLLRPAMRNSYEQGVALWHKKSGARAVRRVDLGNSLVVAWISLLDDVDLTRSADRVDAVALVVVENVIGIARDVDLRDYVARFCVKHDKLCWKTAPVKQSMIRFIECHWKICEG